MEKVDAIIFDLDGVLCSTDRYHYLAWKVIADRLNVPFDEGKNDLLRGVSRMASLEIILKDCPMVLSQSEKEELAEEKNEIYRSYLAKMSPADLSSEVRDSLTALRGLGVQLAVGSSSKNAGLILKQIGLDAFFDAVSDGNNITHSKPDPEVFLKAAEYLSVEPTHCWVVEDAESGIQAARRAGMYAVAYGPAAERALGDCNLERFAQLPRLLERKLGKELPLS